MDDFKLAGEEDPLRLGPDNLAEPSHRFFFARVGLRFKVTFIRKTEIVHGRTVAPAAKFLWPHARTRGVSEVMRARQDATAVRRTLVKRELAVIALVAQDLRRNALQDHTWWARLHGERDTVMKALYAQAVPMELFSSEQARISREMAEAEQVLRTAEEEFDATQRTILRAIDLGENLHETYLKSRDTLRRLINQAWWDTSRPTIGRDRHEADSPDHASALLSLAPIAAGSRVSVINEAPSSRGGLSMNHLVPLIRALSNPDVQRQFARLHRLVTRSQSGG